MVLKGEWWGRLQSTPRRRRLMAQPSDFVTPTLGTGWVYGGVNGEVFQMMTTENANACAQACNSTHPSSMGSR